MILLLGATGYIGQAFEQELKRRGWAFESLSRARVDYTRFSEFHAYLKKVRPEFVVNAAGYTGKPNVDACELAKADTLQGNTLFPQMLAHACAVLEIPWGHVSSGCIYAGAKVLTNGEWKVEKDLTTPALRKRFVQEPSAFRGFTETDVPNFSFRQPPCSFYSGTKALAEESIQGVGKSFVWRLRIPFDEVDNARNYLSKIQRYPKVYDNINSISHRGDFVRACLDLYERRAAFGVYNVTNPGAFSTRQVLDVLKRKLKVQREFEFWADDAEFYAVAAKTPRSNCIMDVSKLLSAGVRMRPALEALDAALEGWVPESK